MIYTPDHQVIAIAGVSRAGKTSAALFLNENITRCPVRVFHLDDFVFAEPLIPKILGHTDWEIPASTDFDRVADVVSESAAHPGITLVEGLFPFTDPRIRRLYNKVIYLSISFNTFYQRKITDSRWGIEPSWYIRHIWLSHFKYGLPPDCSNSNVLHISNYSSKYHPELLDFVGRQSFSATFAP